MFYFLKTLYYIFLNIFSIFYKKKVDNLNEINIKKSNKTLNIALHGSFQSSFSTFYRMIFYFNGKNTPLILIDYNFRQKIEDSSLEINKKINEIIKKNKSRKINLIGHSLGGIIARYYTQNLDKKHLVKKLISIGTPHNNIFKREIFFGRSFNNISLAKKTKNSYIKIINKLNKNDKFKNHISISGENEFIVPKEFSNYRKAKNYILDNLGHFGEMYDKRVFDLILKEIK